MSNRALIRAIEIDKSYAGVHALRNASFELLSPVFRATPLDMKSEADRHFLMGINQLIGHGWPYTAEGSDYPGWRFYAAAVFDEKNAWWIVMPRHHEVSPAFELSAASGSGGERCRARHHEICATGRQQL